MSQRLEKFYKYLMLYQKLVKQNAVKYIGEQLAEDVAQETFLKMYEHLDYLTDDTVRKWLVVVSGNISKDYVKKGGKYETTSVEPEVLLEYVEGHVDSAAEIYEKSLKQKAAQELIRTACNLLYEKNPSWYYIMIDSCYLDMSSIEIAKVLKTSPGNIDVMKSRARKFLKEQLGEEAYELF